jgi:hypothetical protein
MLKCVTETDSVQILREV